MIRTIASTIVCSLLSANASHARQLRVPKDQPTIQAAIDAAHDGDVIAVAPGTYTEKLRIAGKKITLTSSVNHSDQSAPPTEDPILDGGRDGKKTGPPIVYVNSDAELTLRAFTIRSSHHAVVNCGSIDAQYNRFIDNGDALSFESARGTVRFNTFENNSDDGIDLDGSSAAVIEYNVIRNNKDDGIEIRLHKHAGEMLEIVVRRNVIEGNREDGVQLIDYPGMSNRVFSIDRNVIVNNAMAGIGCMPDGDTNEKYTGANLLEPVFLTNNTILGNACGITGGDNMVLLNNVIANTAKVAIKRVHGDSAAGVNLLWKNGQDIENCDLNTAEFVNADPQLDSGYSPLAKSPCLGTGAASLRYNGGLLEISRDSYFGISPNLGAIEVRSPK